MHRPRTGLTPVLDSHDSVPLEEQNCNIYAALPRPRYTYIRSINRLFGDQIRQCLLALTVNIRIRTSVVSTLPLTMSKS